MKKTPWIALGIVALLICAAGAYFWATGLMDSLYAYRSPLHANPPAPGAAIGEPMTRRVVFVLIDALRDDTSHKTDVMPFLNELRSQGAWATSHSRPPSYSEPGYSVLNTGAWPDVSDGPAVNLDYPEIPTWTQDNLFSAAQRAGSKTAVSGYYWFEKLIPQEDVDASFYTPGEDDAADRQVVDAALPWLESGDYQFVLIHIDQVDYAGHHEGGPRDPHWDAAAARADDLLREIVSRLDLEQDTVFVTSDHGQIDRGGHGGQEPVVLVEPFVLAGAGVRPGQYPDTRMVDIAPTLAALLGTNIPADNQGHVLTDMLTLSPEQETAIQNALAEQQRQLFDAYSAAIGETASIAPGGDVVTATQTAMQAALAKRLNRERIPRFVLALVLAAFPAYVLFKKRGQTVAWLLGGALLYVIIFNLRYAVIDGRTYSLSSVASADGLILYTAVTAAIALGVAWLVVSLRLNIFRKGAAKAAQATLALTCITLYLLLLPILWSYALNGAVVTWALPDLASMFMGFISIVQSLMVAVIGLALTGVAALIARLSPSS
ncbi:MAG: hypothetical protein GXP40_03070 [Chloroflexi bacterium]|nr:hypothetical protein [Chloroflexota bacterium]